jgi:hypothetical protein
VRGCLYDSGGAVCAKDGGGKCVGGEGSSVDGSCSRG